MDWSEYHYLIPTVAKLKATLSESQARRTPRWDRVPHAVAWRKLLQGEITLRTATTDAQVRKALGQLRLAANVARDEGFTGGDLLLFTEPVKEYTQWYDEARAQGKRVEGAIDYVGKRYAEWIRDTLSGKRVDENPKTLTDDERRVMVTMRKEGATIREIQEATGRSRSAVKTTVRGISPPRGRAGAPIEEETARQVVAAYMAGGSHGEVAERFGISMPSVRRLVERAGKKTRTRSHGPQARQNVLDSYRATRHLATAARSAGVDLGTARRWLKDAGIYRPETAVGPRRTWSQDEIDLMIEMRSLGHSFRSIAERLERPPGSVATKYRAEVGEDERVTATRVRRNPAVGLNVAKPARKKRSKKNPKKNPRATISKYLKDL